MKLSTMRKIDYWIGVPLCAVVSGFSRIRALFGNRQTVPHTPRRILLIELSEMGSAVLAYPMMRELQHRYAGVEQFFLIFGRNRESVDILQTISPKNVLTIDDKNLLTFLLSTFKVLIRLWRLRCDVAIDLELFSRCTALLAFLSTAAVRIGFHNGRGEGLYRGQAINYPVQFNHHIHMSQNFMALAAVLDGHDDPPYVKRRNFPTHELPAPAITTAQQSKFEEKLSARGILLGKNRLVLLNPDPGALEIRAWPLSSYIELGRVLLNTKDSVMLGVIGLPQSKEMADAIVQAMPAGRCVDLTGVTDSIFELLMLFSRADVLVSSDSGAAHFAAMSQIHGIVFFGPETPILYRPLSQRIRSLSLQLSCSPCLWAENHRDSSCKDNQCLKQITPAIVAEMVNEQLAMRSGLAVHGGR